MTPMRAIHLLFVLMGCAWLGACASQEDPNGKWVARFGGEVITRGDLEQEITRLSLGDLAPSAASGGLQNLRQRILDDMIRERLFLLEAKRRNVLITTDEVERRMNGVLASSAKTPEERKRNIALSALTPAQFKKRNEDELRVEKLFMRDIFPRFLVTEAEVAARYEKDKERYKLPERLRLWQIVTSTEEEANLAFKRLEAGEAFAHVAHEVSITPEKDVGGDMGWVLRDSLPEPFDKLVFELPRKGLNKPYKSPYGFHIFLITDYQPERLPTLEEVSAKVAQDILETKKREAVEALLAHLKERLHVQINPEFLKEATNPT